MMLPPINLYNAPYIFDNKNLDFLDFLKNSSICLDYCIHYMNNLIIIYKEDTGKPKIIYIH